MTSVSDVVTIITAVTPDLRLMLKNTMHTIAFIHYNEEFARINYQICK